MLIKRLFFLFLLLGVSLLLLNHCTYQKRLYRKGYYIEKLSFLKNQPTRSKDRLLNEETIPFKSVDVRRNLIEDNTLASNDNSYFFIDDTHSKMISREKNTLSDTCGDKIILKTGDEFLVKIIEVSDKEIKYKRCDNINGPLYSIAAHKVYMIEYANGIKEHIVSEVKDIKNTPANESEVKASGDKKYSATYWLTWILFVIGFFYGISVFTWPAALFLARKARREIKQNPKLKGKLEMGMIMYFLLFVYTLAATLLIIFGILFIIVDQQLRGSGLYGLGTVFGLLFLIMGISIAYFIWWFIKTTPSDEL